METAVSGEDKEDLAHLVLQIAATSGFVEGIHGIETSCLRLCNACREHVPVQRLQISDPVPRSIASLVYPGLRQPEKEQSSRVLPHRCVLSIHWTFSNANMLCQLEGTKAPIKQENSDATDLLVVGNIDISKVQWPQGMREVALRAFNHSLENVPWPSGLERLWLGEPIPPASQMYWIPDTFDKPLGGVTFPCGLREIFLGNSFDQPIEGIAWPGGLEKLSLPGFNRSIRDVRWPPGLKALEFVSPSRIRLWQDGATEKDFMGFFRSIRGGCQVDLPQGQGSFNQLLGSTLPPSLECLWLSNAYNLPLDGVAWPRGIATLGFPFILHPFLVEGITWPLSVKTIFLVGFTGSPVPKGAQVKTLTVSNEMSPQLSDGTDYDSDRYVDLF